MLDIQSSEISIIDDKRIFILLKDEILFKIPNNETVYSNFILVNVGTDVEYIKQCLSKEYEHQQRFEFFAINPYEDSLLNEENLSDCYFMTLKQNNIDCIKVVNYYLFFKYIEVPESFKASFEKYYDKYYLFKVNPYTDSDLYRELSFAAKELTGISF